MLLHATLNSQKVCFKCIVAIVAFREQMKYYFDLTFYLNSVSDYFFLMCPFPSPSVKRPMNRSQVC